jgi:hypothetical protein
VEGADGGAGVTHRHFLIVVGRWKLENWHLYCLRPHQNRSGRARWTMWDRVL